MGLVIAECARTLTDVGLAIAQYERMPDWIRDEPDEQRSMCLQEAFVRGLDQMNARQMDRQFWLEIRVGGIRGSVYRVGRSFIASIYDYAQLLNAKRNDISDKVSPEGSQKGVMVHNGIYNGGFPQYKTVRPDQFDIECIQAQMEGALSAYDAHVDDPRVEVFLRRALDGDTFRSMGPKDRLHGVIYRGMNGEANGS